MSIIRDLLKLQNKNVLREGLDFFDDVHTVNMDPDRFETAFVGEKIIEGLVKAAYVEMKRAQHKHDRLFDDEEDDKYEMSYDNLRDITEDLMTGLVNWLEEHSSISKLEEICKATKLPEKLS